MDSSRNATLISCSLVCKSWLPRAQMHLFYYMHANRLEQNELECLGFTTLQKHFLTQNIQQITLDGHNLCARDASIFVLALDKPRLQGCTIRSLWPRDNPLTSVSFGRFAFDSLKDIAERLQSIRRLSLLDCGIRDAQILADSLNHFQSLSIFLISWESKTRFLGQHHPPPAKPRYSYCLLTSLAIEIVPNVSTFLSFFVETRPLVSYLKYLMVSCSFSNLVNLLQEIAELLLHCSQSLEELTIVVGQFFEHDYPQEAGTSSSCVVLT